jgi:hypothetical protein
MAETFAVVAHYSQLRMDGEGFEPVSSLEHSRILTDGDSD